MKIIKFFIHGFVLITAFSFCGFSQTVSSQIASINTAAFFDNQNGIKEVVEANEKLEAELKSQTDELKLIKRKHEKLSVELKNLSGTSKLSQSVNYKVNGEKINEIRLNESQMNVRQNDFNILYGKRKAEIFAEIYKKTQDAMMKFAKENGFVIILDSSIENNSIIIEEEPIDVTQKFIEFYNKNYVLDKIQ